MMEHAISTLTLLFLVAKFVVLSAVLFCSASGSINPHSFPPTVSHTCSPRPISSERGTCHGKDYMAHLHTWRQAGVRCKQIRHSALHQAFAQVQLSSMNHSRFFIHTTRGPGRPCQFGQGLSTIDRCVRRWWNLQKHLTQCIGPKF